MTSRALLFWAAAVAILSATTAAAVENWVFIGKNTEGVSYEIDAASFSHVGGDIAFRVRDHYAKPEGPAQITYIATRQVSCAEGTVFDSHTDYYRSGKAVRTTGAEPKLVPGANSIGALIVSKVCLGEIPQAGLAPSKPLPTAAGWAFVVSAEGEAFELDRNSIKREGQHVTVLVRRHYAKPQPELHDADSYVAKRSIDCTERSYRDIRNDLYAGERLVGSSMLLATHPYSPGTITAAVVDAACGVAVASPRPQAAGRMAAPAAKTASDGWFLLSDFQDSVAEADPASVRYESGPEGKVIAATIRWRAIQPGALLEYDQIVSTERFYCDQTAMWTTHDDYYIEGRVALSDGGNPKKVQPPGTRGFDILKAICR